ncbi:MAG: MotA/TolQ/ExbB proton channel family protein [Phycisphaerales bacterium]|nr:MotA/TolQ/ExbB proton channel family protein [Phycisphaerales bacterium]
MNEAWLRISELVGKGGLAMWPLIGLSVLSLTLTVERSIFWIGNHRPGRRRWLRSIADRLRAGDHSGVQAATETDGSLYGSMVRLMLRHGIHDNSAVELAETYRSRVERFSNLMAVIVTAGPLLGILGTVLGIIQSFGLLGSAQVVTDINEVAAGIAKALITTAFGLMVAIGTLFPHMVFRAQADRCMSVIETLVAAAQQGVRRK